MPNSHSDPWAVSFRVDKTYIPLSPVELKTARKSMLLVVGTLGAFFALRVVFQDLLTWGVGNQDADGVLLSTTDELLLRALVEFSTAGIGFLLVYLVRPGMRSGLGMLISIIVIALLTAGFKTGFKTLVGLHHLSHSYERVGAALEILNTTIVVAVIIILGMIIARVRWRSIRNENLHAENRERLVRLLSASQASELELRERVSGSLYSSLERLFVTVEAQLNHLAGSTADETDLVRREKRLRGIAMELARMRTGELRALTGVVYPINLSIGLGPALRAILDQMPPYVTPRLDFDDTCTALEDGHIEKVHSVMITRTAEIGVLLAVRRAEVRNVSLALDLNPENRKVTITVEDDGIPSMAASLASALDLIELQLEVYEGAMTVEHPTPHSTVFRAHFTLPAPEPSPELASGREKSGETTPQV